MAKAKTRGVSISYRRTKDGTIVFDARWRERIDGRQVQRSKSFAREDDATTFIREIDNRLEIVRRGRSLADSILMQPKPLDFAIEAYFQSRKAVCKPTSAYPKNVRRMLIRDSHRMGWTLTTHIGQSDMASLERLYGRHRRCGYMAWSAFRSFLSWCTGQQWATNPSYLNHPFILPKAKESYAFTLAERVQIEAELQRRVVRPATPFRRSTPELREYMLALCDERVRHAFFPVFWLMCHWAPRPLETVLLRVQDWNPTTRRLLLPPEITKTGRERDFIVDERTAAILTDSCGGRGGSEYLFLSSWGKRWCTGFMSRFMRRIILRLKVDRRAYLYSCRHHACTMLCRMLKGRLKKVQKITGHQLLSELQRYLHDNEDEDLAAKMWDNELHPPRSA